MKERLILTICVNSNDSNNKGNVYEKYAKYTLPLIEDYSKKVNSDFIVLNKPDCKYHTCNKYQIGNFLNEYKRVLYLDADIVIKPNSPDIFSKNPLVGFCVFETERLWNNLMKKYLSQMEPHLSNESSFLRCKTFIENNRFYAKNAGVILVSSEFKHCFERPIYEIQIGAHRDQIWQNYLILKNNISIHKLEECWNFRFPYKNKKRVEGAFDKNNYFIHFTEDSYLGGTSKSYIKDFIEKCSGKNHD